MGLKIGSVSDAGQKYLATKNGQPSLYSSGELDNAGLDIAQSLSVTYQASDTNPQDITVGEGIVAHAEGVEDSQTAVGSNKIFLFDALEAVKSNANPDAVITEITCSDSNAIAFGDGLLGRSMAIHDGYVYVGAPRWPAVFTDRGKVFKFSIQGEESNQFAYLTSPGPGYFGEVVAAGCGKVAVSTASHEFYEFVWLYNTDFTNPIIISRPPQYSTKPFFGFDLAIGDDLLVITHEGNSTPGTAYIYDLEGNYLRELPSPEPSPQGNDDYGYSAAIGEGIIAIGAIGESNPSPVPDGAVYLFDYNGKFIKKIIHAESDDVGSIGGRFGENVSISGGRLYVGDSTVTSQDGVSGYSNHGIITVFDLEGNFIDHFLPRQRAVSKYYGRGMHVSNGFMVTRGLTDFRGEWDVRSVVDVKTPLSMKTKYIRGIE
jgi:hypothetical protein